ncbi:glutaredoxin 2 [Neobacillus bataviensis LMG 21833]|uniref:Glutaredoxin 2 n=1 Tax=Neobacillus bataviensis LMG 21833 TaxID=1117379 RepID=K6CJT9_9BACI|nr:glutaredoxin family protein [Neobacillus bataviensis]EKN71435.1 glutaredoxin 2 [Neobacillus bataviensis LMG 21833]
MTQTTITLYTRNRCPLCDKAKVTLDELKQEWNFKLEEVDIETSDELTERYGLMIPVVHLDGEEVGFGFVDKFDISNRLQEKTKSNELK